MKATQFSSDTTQDTSNWSRVFGIDLRTLALFRMGIAAVLCGDLLERLIHVRFYYTDAGLLPKPAIDQLFGSSIKWTSLHYHTGGNVWLQSSMILLGMILAISLFAGYRTKLATILSWLLFISLNRRVSAICTGGDDLMRLMLLWSVFLPLGARWSIDARNRLAKGEASRPESNRFCSVGTCAILLQLCYVYFFTAIIKFAGATWLDGSAIRHALQFEVHVRPLGIWLSEQDSFLFFLTYSTLFAEFCMPLLVFSPVMNPAARWLAICTMVSLHLGIFLCLTIGTFPFVCMVCWILFIPTETWEWLLSRRQAPSNSAVEPARYPFEQSRPVSLLVLSLLLFVTVYNVLGIEQLNRIGIRVPGPMKSVAKLTRLDQKWKMYAPSPASTDGWFLMPCLLSDGTTFDVYRNEPVGYSKPELLSAGFPTARIKKMFLVNRARKNSPLWRWVVKYYTDKWNAAHPDRRVVRAQITFIGEDTHEARPYAFPYVEYDLQSGEFTPLVGTNLLGVH